MELGHRLKLFRVAAGLKQLDLAERLGVTKNYIYMVESGRREPSRGYVEKFSDAVNVPLSVIYLKPSKIKDAKTRKLLQRVITLLSEYADATGVTKYN